MNDPSDQHGGAKLDRHPGATKLFGLLCIPLALLLPWCASTGA